jgi:hypothetical protein
MFWSLAAAVAEVHSAVVAAVAACWWPLTPIYHRGPLLSLSALVVLALLPQQHTRRETDSTAKHQDAAIYTASVAAVAQAWRVPPAALMFPRMEILAVLVVVAQQAQQEAIKTAVREYQAKGTPEEQVTPRMTVVVAAVAQVLPEALVTMAPVALG